MCEVRQQESEYFDALIDKSLQGIARIHDGLIILEGCRTILRKDYTNMTGKVKLISGGKVEDELIYAGFVSPGMLTAAIFGNIASAPSVDTILRVIEQIGSDHSSGILLITQNDPECTINFTLAKLHAEAKGYIVKLITVNNNDLSRKFENTIKELDILSMLFIYKLAGAMSEEGRSIDDIYNLCNSVTNNGEIALLNTGFGKVTDEVCRSEILSNLAREVLEPIKNRLTTTSQNQINEGLHQTKTFCVGHEVAIILSNFDCSQIQANVFLLELLKEMEVNGLHVKRTYVKQFKTHLNNSGFHICLLNLSLTTELTKYLDFPTFAFAWPKMITSKLIGLEEDYGRKLLMLGIYSKDAEWCDITLQGPIMNYETSQAFLFIMSMACEAVVACTKQLNKMDEEFGHGNYGTSLARGARAIQDAIQQNKILGTNLSTTFMQVSHIIQKIVGGLQGGLYSLFFYNVGKAFSKHQNDTEITVDMWLYVLSTANKAMEQFKISTAGEQKLLTALVAVETDLEDALNRNMDPIDAFGAAVKAAENFTTNILYEQSTHGSKYPDPRAHAVGIWMRAAYEGTKLKLIYRNTK